VADYARRIVSTNEGESDDFTHFNRKIGMATALEWSEKEGQISNLPYTVKNW